MVRFLLSALLAAAIVHAQQPAPTDATPPAASAGKVPEPARLEGKVVSDTTGEGLRKATLALRLSSNPRDGGLSVTTDNEGKFVFPQVPPGQYRLTTERAGYLRQEYGARSGMGMGQTITLGPGGLVKDVQVRMQPQATLSGRVLDQDGDPIQRAHVNVLRRAYFQGQRRWMPMQGNMTDPGGEFKVANLQAGQYLVCASVDAGMMMGMMGVSEPPRPADGKPEEAPVMTCYPNVTNPDEAATVEVQPGRDMPGLDIRMQTARVFRVRGKVAAPDGGGRIGVMLMPADRAAGVGMGMMNRNMAQVKSDGTFEMRNVRPGSYSLTLMRFEGMSQTLGRTPLQVGDQDVEGVVVTATPPITVSGTIRIEGETTTQLAEGQMAGRMGIGAGGGGGGIRPSGGAPAAATPDAATKPRPSDVRVMLASVEGFSFAPGEFAKTDGTFTLANVAPDKYRVSTFMPGDGLYLKSARWNGQDVTESPLDLTQGGSGTLEILFSRNGAELSGVAQGADGKPMAGAMVTLIPEPAREERNHRAKTASTDQNGQFRITSVAPGRYKLYAWEQMEYGAAMDPEYTKPHAGKAVDVSLEEKARETRNVTVIAAK